MPRIDSLIPTALPRLALSVRDLARADALARGKVQPLLDLGNPLTPEPGAPALGFACPLTQACLAADLLRGWDREAGDEPIRAWVRGERGGWRAVPAWAQLAVQVNGQWQPNPAWFGGALAVEDRPERMDF